MSLQESKVPEGLLDSINRILNSVPSSTLHIPGIRTSTETFELGLRRHVHILNGNLHDFFIAFNSE